MARPASYKILTAAIAFTHLVDPLKKLHITQLLEEKKAAGLKSISKQFIDIYMYICRIDGLL